MANYWHIVLWDGENIPVKPENVGWVQGKIARKEDMKLTNRTVIIKNIKDFVPTDIPVREPVTMIESGIAEDEARAFNEVMENPDGSVIVRAVKKSVPRRKWETFYAANPAYKLLKETEGGVEVGFLLPVHQIRYDTVQDCSAEEEKYVMEKR